MLFRRISLLLSTIPYINPFLSFYISLPFSRRPSIPLLIPTFYLYLPASQCNIPPPFLSSFILPIPPSCHPSPYISSFFLLSNRSTILKPFGQCHLHLIISGFKGGSWSPGFFAARGRVFPKVIMPLLTAFNHQSQVILLQCKAS